MALDELDIEERMSTIKKRAGQKIKDIALGLLIGIFVTIIIYLMFSKWNPKERTIEVVKPDASTQTVTIETISKKLENIGELSSAEMTYSGIYTVEDGTIPFLTKKGFSMVYAASVKAGIEDISQIKIEVSERSVDIDLPEIKITNIHVDPNSIGFYDEKHALFNPDRKTDVTQAISIAEEDLAENLDTSDLIDLASKRSEILVKALLEDAVEDRIIRVN